MATETSDSIRPTKKQRELLSYIEQFIGEHGYSPSYREIMNGLNYTSVATVSLHVTSLIRRGHLRKRDRSARSLEVVAGGGNPVANVPDTPQPEEAWLIEKVAAVFKEIASTEFDEHKLDNLRVLVKALEFLGMHDAAKRFTADLEILTNQEVKHA